MSNFMIKFNNIKAIKAFMIYSQTALELDFSEIAYESNESFSNGTITYDGAELDEFSELFTALSVALIEEFTKFNIEGTYSDPEIIFTANYEKKVLTVTKNKNGTIESASYQLINGRFDNEDGAEFSCFFD